MNVIHKLFEYTRENDPDAYREILELVRPYSLESVKKILCRHFAKSVSSLRPIEERREAIPAFLLRFVSVARRQFPQAGDPIGILLTCRLTNRYTQQFLDVRHLRDPMIGSKNAVGGGSSSAIVKRALHYQINAFSDVNQVLEIARNRKFSQLLVKSRRVVDLLRKIPKSGHVRDARSASYVNTLNFIVSDSFAKNVRRVLYRKKKDLELALRRIPVSEVVALTDVKYVYDKCGIACFFFNYVSVLKHQFFKKSVLNSRDDHDVLNVVRFQCYTGAPLPINRTGLKRNPNRSSLEKLCFEAVKQNFADEAVAGREFQVRDSTSKMFFGQRFNEGTGYDGFVPQVK